MIGIYKIKNQVNGKIYIGQSINIEQRWYNHRNELNGDRHCNGHLQAAWNKYGEENFIFEIIEECILKDIDNKEKYWIDFYNSTNPNLGYNLTCGGQGMHGYKWTEEQRNHQSKIFNPEPILQLDLKGNIIERWRSASFAARETGFPISGIMNCLKEEGDQYQTHNFIWIYENKYFSKDFNINEYISTYIKERQRVFQYDLYGTLTKIWESTSEIIKEYGLRSNEYKTISKCLNHEIKSYKGYIYLYENDCLELTEDYLRKCRVNCYKYKINQFDLDKNFIKTWTIEELKNSEYRFDTIRKCCTDNLLGHRVNGKAFSYIWEYE